MPGINNHLSAWKHQLFSDKKIFFSFYVSDSHSEGKMNFYSSVTSLLLLAKKKKSYKIFECN